MPKIFCIKKGGLCLPKHTKTLVCFFLLIPSINKLLAVRADNADLTVRIAVL